MDNNQNESDDLQKTKSFTKSQAILKKAINSTNLEREEYIKETTNNLLLQQTTTLSRQKTPNFYRKYKSYLSNTIYLLNKYKAFRYSKEKNFAKYKTLNPTLKRRKIEIYLNKLFVIQLRLKYFLRTKLNVAKSKSRKLKNQLIVSKPNLLASAIKQILFTEKYILYYLIVFKRKLQNNFLINLQQLNDSDIAINVKTNRKKLEAKIKKLTEKIVSTFTSFDRKTVLKYLERFGFILKIYFLPFIFLANQALIPFIQEYEEMVVNSFSSVIFERIPFLISIIKLFNPIINSFNKMFQFWVLIAYFLIFPLGYRSLKLSYKLGYNGSIALIFLLINSSLSFSQEIIIAIFESLKMIKDILFTSYLVKHLGKSKNKEREEALRIFNNLVQRYELQIRQDYFNWLLFLNHYVLSPLAFISIAVLVYNCLYYIIYNKNPKIPLVTKAALATIKNPQEEE